LEGLVISAYETPDPVVGPALAHCTHIYVARDEGEHLVAASFVCFELLPTPFGPTLYLGQCIVGASQRRSGWMTRICARIADDARLWENMNGQRLVCWGIAANPVMPSVWLRTFAGLEPSITGHTTPMGHAVAQVARASLGAVTPESHPMVLRAAYGSRYTSDERRRMIFDAATPYSDLFRGLKIREENGDRIVFACRVSNSRN
jgi:hypothetical protein